MTRCATSNYFTGWPCRCGQPMDPPHVTTIDGRDVAVCGACCPAKHKTTFFSTKNEDPTVNTVQADAAGADCPDKEKS